MLVNVSGKSLVIDCSPDFRQQMLLNHIGKIDGIIFTHAHKDHTGGLDEIRGYNYVLQKAIPLYMNEETLAIIKKQYDYIFNGSDYPGIPQVDIKVINDKHFEIDSVKIQPIEVLHYQMRVFAYRIDDFTYITDANFISKQEMRKIAGSKVVVVNALRKQDHISHFNLKQAVEVIKELNPEKAYLTHISHQMGFQDEVSRELPDGIGMAYDGLKIEL